MVNGGGLGPEPNSRTIPLQDMTTLLDNYEKQYLPSQPKSLSGIATRAFILGLTLTLSLNLTIYLLLDSSPYSPLWRAPFFITTLSAFHFLEFWTTARYNTRSAQISSFLLSQNGSAYTIAHTAAFLECLLTNLLFPTRSWLPPRVNTLLLSFGLVLILLGQAIRSIAMISAGTNFNHIVQHTKASSHQLVTSGIYGWLRHPSYFGYFWWGLGTQIVMGNLVCFVGYAVVLWRFFERRIGGEEELLIRFFGDEYVQYRKRTMIGIPFI